MKRNEYAGWKEVFIFSLRQEIKQKSFRGFLILMCLVILAVMPVSAWLQRRVQEQIKATDANLTEQTITTHRAIVKAIGRREPEGAREAMLRHMQYNMEHIAGMMKKN